VVGVGAPEGDAHEQRDELVQHEHLVRVRARVRARVRGTVRDGVRARVRVRVRARVRIWVRARARVRARIKVSTSTWSTSVSPISPLHLACISPIPPLHLPCISPGHLVDLRLLDGPRASTLLAPRLACAG
jgi:hypothetical protein